MKGLAGEREKSPCSFHVVSSLRTLVPHLAHPHFLEDVGKRVAEWSAQGPHRVGNEKIDRSLN